MLTATMGKYFVVEEPETPQEAAERAKQNAEKEKEIQKRKELAVELEPELKKTKNTIPFFATTPELLTSLQKSFTHLIKTAEQCETKKSDFYSKEAFSIHLRKKLVSDAFLEDIKEGETVSGLQEKYAKQVAAFEQEIIQERMHLQDVLLSWCIDKKLQEQKIIELKKCNEAQQISHRNKIIATMQTAAKKYHIHLQRDGQLGEANKKKLLVKFGSIVSLSKEGDLDYTKGNGFGLSFDLAKNKVERGSVDFTVSQIVEQNSVGVLLEHFNYIVGKCTGFSQARSYLLRAMATLVDQYPKHFQWKDEQVQVRRKTMEADKDDVIHRATVAANVENEKRIKKKAISSLEKITKIKQGIEKEIEDHIILMEKVSVELQKEKIDGFLKEAGVYQLEVEEIQRATECLHKIERQLQFVDAVYQGLIEKIKKLDKLKNKLSEKKKNCIKAPLAEMQAYFEEYEKILSDDRVIQELDQRIKTTKIQNGAQWNEKYAAKLILLQADIRTLQERYNTLKIRGTKSFQLPYALSRFFKLKLINTEIIARNQGIQEAHRKLNENAEQFLKLHNDFGKQNDSKREQSNSFAEIHALIKAMQEDVNEIQKIMDEQTQLYAHAEKKLNKMKEKIDPSIYSEHQAMFDHIKESYAAGSAAQKEAIKRHEGLLNQFGTLKKYNAIVTHRDKLRKTLDAAFEDSLYFNTSADTLDADFSRFDRESFIEAPEDIQGLQQKIKEQIRDLGAYRKEIHFSQAGVQLQALDSLRSTLKEGERSNEILDININPGVETLERRYQILEQKMLAERKRIAKIDAFSMQMKNYTDVLSHYKVINNELQNAQCELDKLTILFNEIDSAAGFIDQYSQTGNSEQIDVLKKRIETKRDQAQATMEGLHKHHERISFNDGRMKEFTATLTIQQDEKNSPILKKTAERCDEFAKKITEAEAKMATFARVMEEAQIKHDQAWHANLDKETAIQFIHFLYSIIMNNLMFWQDDVRYQWVGGGVSIIGLDGENYRIATGLKTMIDDLKLFIDNPKKTDPFVTLQKIAATAQKRYDLGQTESEYTFWKARRDSVNKMYTYLKTINTKNVKFDILSNNISQLKNSNNKSLVSETLPPLAPTK